jgi:hypothetical protein
VLYGRKRDEAEDPAATGVVDVDGADVVDLGAHARRCDNEHPPLSGGEADGDHPLADGKQREAVVNVDGGRCGGRTAQLWSSRPSERA